MSTQPLEWTAVAFTGNATISAPNPSTGPKTVTLGNEEEVRSSQLYNTVSNNLLLDIPLPVLNHADDSFYLGGRRYFGHCTYPNLITFKFNSTVIGTPQTYQDGDRFRIYFDGFNVSFSLNNYFVQTLLNDSYVEQDLRMSVSSPTQQNIYTFNNVNMSFPQQAQGPVYASTVFENVTLNNSDYNSFLGNHAVPKGYVDQKVADLVNGAPAALDTLKELSDALNGDANLATSLINLVSEEKSRAQAAEAAIQSSLSTTSSSLQGITASLSADIVAEIARAQAAESKVASDLATETARAQAAESKVASDLSTETARAQAAESKVASDLSTETARAQAAESKVASDLTSEVVRAQAAESKVASDLATETARAQAAESKVASDLTSETVRAQAAETKVATDLTAEVVRAQAADSKIASDLTAEVVRAQAAESKVATDLTAEAVRAQAADSKIASDLTAETVRAQAAETKVATDLAAEVVRSQAAESKVASDLATETARAQAAESKVASDLTAESVRAQAAETKVASDLATETARAQAAESKITADADDMKIQLNTEVSRAQEAESKLYDRVDMEFQRAVAAENTKVNLSGSNTLAGPLTLDAGMKISLNGSSFLYIGTNWRINAGNNGKTLLFEYNQNPYLGGSWVTAVPFIQSM